MILKQSRLFCFIYTVVCICAIYFSSQLIEDRVLYSKVMGDEEAAGFALVLGVIVIVISGFSLLFFGYGIIRPRTILTIDEVGVTYGYLPFTKISFPWSAVKSFESKSLLHLKVFSVNFTDEYLNELSMTRESIGIIWKMCGYGNVNIIAVAVDYSMYGVSWVFKDIYEEYLENKKKQ